MALNQPVSRSVEFFSTHEHFSIEERLFLGHDCIAYANRVNLDREEATRLRDKITGWLDHTNPQSTGWLTREMERIG